MGYCRINIRLVCLRRVLAKGWYQPQAVETGLSSEKILGTAVVCGPHRITAHKQHAQARLEV